MNIGVIGVGIAGIGLMIFVWIGIKRGWIK
jgi:hypothetical protein